MQQDVSPFPLFFIYCLGLPQKTFTHSLNVQPTYSLSDLNVPVSRTVSVSWPF